MKNKEEDEEKCDSSKSSAESVSHSLYQNHLSFFLPEVIESDFTSYSLLLTVRKMFHIQNNYACIEFAAFVGQKNAWNGMFFFFIFAFKRIQYIVDINFATNQQSQ